MATTNDHETDPLGFDPVEVAAAAMTSGVPDEHDTVVTPRPDAPMSSDDILPPDGGRRARREASEAGRLPLATPSPLGRFVIPVALVLIAAIGVVASWTRYQARGDTTTASAVGPAVPTGAVTTPVAPLSPSSTASTEVSPSSVPSGASLGPLAPDASAPASPSASVPASAPASSPPSASARPIDRTVPVVVLNATSRSGLAGRVAAALRAKGWNVTSVGNWTRGGIDRTTIYLNGHLDAQATIRKDFPYAKGPILYPLAAMPRLRMIVVVGDDYPA